MSKENLLIEIGLEEMPAPFVTDAMEQFKSRAIDWFNGKQIAFDTVDAYSTPRRLSLFITGVADKQDDREEEARGPAKNIAVDDEGNWSKAAQGFARGQGVSVKHLYIQDVKGKEYVFAKKFLEGRRTIELLPEFKQLITSMSFPKSMRWGDHHLRFIRPIRWLLALFGEDVVPFSITGVKSGRLTYGHRFLGDKAAFKSAAEYKETLLGQFVIADPHERKEAVRQQLQTLAEDEGWKIPIDEDLLEEVNNLVEYPTALYGSFDEEFLQLPKEVLLTSMREHQRYFPVEDEKGDLLPHFVTVRNGDHKHLANVARGNEKVLRARLSDAVFFYKEDQKLTISEALSRLDHIVFQEALGTMGEKVKRVQKLSKTIVEKLELDQTTMKNVDRAAEICKFDLVTHMVDEFSELQGVMGEKYARLAGEDESVAVAVKEHYQPRFKGDDLPESVVGAVVAVADKLDTIVGCFTVGLIPSGSQDPYALRRNALGIVQIVSERDWNLTLEELIEASLQVYRNQDDQISRSLADFFRTRIKTLMQEQNISYDVVDAVLADNIGNLDYLFARAAFLEKKRAEPEFKPLVEALSRVTNIASKADVQDLEVDTSLFEDEKERDLYEAGKQAIQQVAEGEKTRNPEVAYQALGQLQEPIHRYFDGIMVMAEDEILRQNRLKQMKILSDMIRSFADFNAIVL